MDDYSLDDTLDTVEFALINLVKRYPELYNAQDPANRDKRKKDMAWAEIARQLNKDEGWCYAKWKNLSDYYKKRKKIYGSISSGAPSVTMRRWVYYDALSFLDTCETNREDTSSVTMINTFGEHSRSSTEYNYFDETQYHSLDGITDRASIKFRPFLEPIIETQTCLPPAKRQRATIVKDADSQDSETTNFPGGIYKLQPEVNDSPVIPDDHARVIGSYHVRRPRSAAKANNCFTLHPSQIARHDSQSGTESTIPTDNLKDCPHSHFCMSLAARFRKMDPATATFTQMKIMELILKTEFPEEYNKRLETV